MDIKESILETKGMNERLGKKMKGIKLWVVTRNGSPIDNKIYFDRDKAAKIKTELECDNDAMYVKYEVKGMIICE